MIAERQAREAVERKAAEDADRRAKEQQRQADLAAQEHRKKEEQARLAEIEFQKTQAAAQEKQRILNMIEMARKEICGEVAGIVNLRAIFMEKSEKHM